MNTRRVTVSVVINGKDITQDLTPYMTGFSYTDNLDGESDLAEINLEDREHLWLKEWFPTRGDVCDVAIVRQNWQGEEVLNLKSFEIDEISNSYPPSTAAIKLNSVPNNSVLRSVNQSKAWEKVKLSKIAGDIAAESGMELFYDAPDDPTLERAEQKEQSKLQFLQKLCKDNGLALKVSEEKLIIFDAEKYESQEPVLKLSVGDDKVKRFSATATISKIYSACHVKYQHGKNKEMIEYTYTDSSKAEGMTLEINKKVESAAEAEKLAKKELRDKNKEEVKVQLELVGGFEYLAGNVIELDDSYGFYAGNYIIEKATHKVGGGYNCSVELRKCLTGY